MATIEELSIGQYWRVNSKSECGMCDDYFGDSGYIKITSIEEGELHYEAFDNKNESHGTCYGCIDADDLTRLIGAAGILPSKETSMTQYFSYGGVVLEIGQRWIVEEGVGCMYRYHFEQKGGFIEITSLADGYLRYNVYNGVGERVGSCSGCVKPSNLLLLVGGASMMQLTKLTAGQEAILPEPAKSMVEFGVLDCELTLTPAGKELFNTFMYEVNQSKFELYVKQKVLETKAEIAAAEKAAKAKKA